MEKLDQQLTTLFQDSIFAEEAKNFKTVEDMKKALEAHGIEMSIDEVTELCVAIGKRAAQENGEELSEEALDDVAGGFGVVVWTCIGVGVLCIGAFALGVYNGYKGKK